MVSGLVIPLSENKAQLFVRLEMCLWEHTGYLEHEQDRAVFIDIDLHHGQHPFIIGDVW